MTTLRNRRLLCAVLAIVCLAAIVAFSACDATKYTISFDPNYPDAQITVVTQQAGATFTPPTLTRNGYTLEGWYADSACTQRVDKFTAQANATYYAKWVESAAPVTLVAITAQYVGGELHVGDSLTEQMFAVTAHYSDGSEHGVTTFTVGSADMTKAGVKQVQISYTEQGQTVSCMVEVTIMDNTAPVALVSITAEYVGSELHVGDSLTEQMFAVTAHYSDDSEHAVTTFTIGSVDMSQAGTKQVQISYSEQGQTAFCMVEVTVMDNTAPVTLVAITAQYVGGELHVGDSLTAQMFVVTAHYSDGSEHAVTTFTVGSVDMSQAGTKQVQITYAEQDYAAYCTVEITVSDSAAVVLDITAQYTGSTLRAGGKLLHEDITVTVHYPDGSERIVTVFTLGSVDMTKPGSKQVEVSYTEGGFTASCMLTVVVMPNQLDNEYDASVISNEQLSIHFLELGNKYTGDSVYIKAGDTDILIDAGSKKDSSATIARYINQYCTDGILEYVVATHAHEDHIAGFVGNNNSGIFDLYKCNTIIEFARSDSTSNIYSNYKTKRDKEVREGAKCYTALQCVNNANGAQKVYTLADGITMEVLYQKYYESKASDENNYSVCVLISQGDKHYLFTGDLGKEGEESLVSSNPNLPEVELFKGAHHGSYTASNEVLLSKIKPKCVCVCTCMGTSQYNASSKHVFPAQEFCDRVAKYTDRVYVTSYAIDYNSGNVVSANGNIVFGCTDGTVCMYFSNNSTKLKDTDWFKKYRTCPAEWKN